VDTYIEIFEEDSTYNWDHFGNKDDNSGEGSNALLNKTILSGTTYTIIITPKSGTSGSFTFIVE